MPDMNSNGMVRPVRAVTVFHGKRGQPMKKLLIAGAFGLALMAGANTAEAHVYDRDDSDHPLRIVAYALHPFGMAVEYGILRPIHWLVSQPTADKIFGHEPDREKEAGTYFEFK
jgi:hypothetical protein